MPSRPGWRGSSGMARSAPTCAGAGSTAHDTSPGDARPSGRSPYWRPWPVSLKRTKRRQPPYHRPGANITIRATPLPHEPRRILVVKLFALGDLLNTTPALRALRARFPQARIDVLTTRQGKPGLANSPHIDDVLVFEKALFDKVGGLASPRALLAGL